MKSDTTEHGFTTSVYESPSRRSLRSGSQSVSAETAIFYPHTACLRHQVDNCAKCMAEERKSLRESQTRAKVGTFPLLLDHCVRVAHSRDFLGLARRPNLFPLLGTAR